ncbi:MAG: hypothetical protein ACE5G9_03685 [Nitrospinales bacterium]
MVIGISHEDMKKLRAQQKAASKISPRKKRTATLSKKFKDKAFKNFDQSPSAKNKDTDISVDLHVKLNDNYQRTGLYVPKGK